jgi:hydrogenase maturation protein HypF
MAEHGLDEPVIGVSFDGTGFGLDGAIWGGEFLVCDYEKFERVAHLRYVPLPGGDAAIRQPWRIALSHLIHAGADLSFLEKRIDPASLRTVRQMIQRKFNSPPTSSAGRLFDAIACIAGVRDTVSFEAQAAMQLEWLAAQSPPDGSYPFELTRENGPTVIDTRPLIRAAAQDAADGKPAPLIARRFHTTVVEMILKTVTEIRQSFNLNIVALSGGAFMNRLLAEEVSHRLVSSGFRVLRQTLVPPNDGGLSLGQLAVAIARIYKDDKEHAHVSGNPR